MFYFKNKGQRDQKHPSDLQLKTKYEERRPTRCNNQMFIINFCLNMFRASLCPSSEEGNKTKYEDIKTKKMQQSDVYY